MIVCPAGHRSEEPDYCSLCGARIAASLAPPRAAPGEACPSCGELRDVPDARYCEVCRFDFIERRPGPPPVARTWELRVSVDPALDTDPDPDAPCPRDEPEVVVRVDRDLLVGRRDQTRAIEPEIALGDPGASRRHARFVRETDGGERRRRRGGHADAPPRRGRGHAGPVDAHHPARAAVRASGETGGRP